MGRKIGFYGAGNMGRAMIEGLMASGLFAAKDIVIYDVFETVAETLGKELGVTKAADPRELAGQAETLVFSVKPHVLPELLTELKDALGKDRLLISVAAGVSIGAMEKVLSPEHKIVRVMPNTPALVRAGMTAVAPNAMITEEEKQFALSIFRSFGKAELVPEKLIDVVTGVSGSGPAYVYMFIEAMADAAVLEGMPRNLAYEFAGQTCIGAAKMVLETGRHPGELKDMVCSPGGTTIAAVASLEKNGMRSAVIDAVRASTRRSRELG